MDFKQLQSFVAVVECMSFTRAAEQLFLSQPTISAHIRALEEELHTPLIIRTTKSIAITEKGKAIYQDAQAMLEIRERMIQSCSAQEKRIIRIAASTIPASYLLPEILPEFGRLFPQIYFSIHRRDSKDVLEGVAQGRFDLGLSTMGDDHRLMCQRVCRDRMILITPVSDHFLRLSAMGEVSFEEMLSHPIILREKSETGQKQSDQVLARLGIDEKNLNVVARANDQETVKNLVAGGMGVSLISKRAAQNFIDEKRILCFELPLQSEKNIYIAARKGDWHQEHIQRFAQFVHRKYAHEAK